MIYNMRNFKKNAVILSIKKQGEQNRLVTYFTKEDGICTSILYGGPKSKLRSKVSQWNIGTIYVYIDEVKKSSKITDFDVTSYHLSFNESLFKMWAASFATEVVFTTKCAGSIEECFFLFTGFLDGLDIATEQQGITGLIRFLWRYLNLLGILPNNYKCLKCQNPFFYRNQNQNTIEYKEGGAFYSQTENGFICHNCFNEYYSSLDKKTFFKISSKAEFYLEATEFLEPSISRNIMLSDQEILELKHFVFAMIEIGAGTKFKTLKSGIGIL